MDSVQNIVILSSAYSQSCHNKECQLHTQFVPTEAHITKHFNINGGSCGQRHCWQTHLSAELVPSKITCEQIASVTVMILLHREKSTLCINRYKFAVFVRAHAACANRKELACTVPFGSYSV